MNPAGKSFLFDQEQRWRSEAQKRQQKVTFGSARRRPLLLSRINNFITLLSQVRRIRIEVTFNYQEANPETLG